MPFLGQRVKSSIPTLTSTSTIESITSGESSTTTPESNTTTSSELTSTTTESTTPTSDITTTTTSSVTTSEDTTASTTSESSFATISGSTTESPEPTTSTSNADSDSTTTTTKSTTTIAPATSCLTFSLIVSATGSVSGAYARNDDVSDTRRFGPNPIYLDTDATGQGDLYTIINDTISGTGNSGARMVFVSEGGSVYAERDYDIPPPSTTTTTGSDPPGWTANPVQGAKKRFDPVRPFGYAQPLICTTSVVLEESGYPGTISCQVYNHPRYTQFYACGDEPQLVIDMPGRQPRCTPITLHGLCTDDAPDPVRKVCPVGKRFTLVSSGDDIRPAGNKAQSYSLGGAIKNLQFRSTSGQSATGAKLYFDDKCDLRLDGSNYLVNIRTNSNGMDRIRFTQDEQSVYGCDCSVNNDNAFSCSCDGDSIFSLDRQGYVYISNGAPPFNGYTVINLTAQFV